MSQASWVLVARETIVHTMHHGSSDNSAASIGIITEPGKRC